MDVTGDPITPKLGILPEAFEKPLKEISVILAIILTFSSMAVLSGYIIAAITSHLATGKERIPKLSSKIIETTDKVTEMLGKGYEKFDQVSDRK